MKNYKLIVVVTMLLLIIMSSSVTNANNLDGYAGFSFNTYDLEDINDYAEEFDAKAESIGFGFFGGVRKWLNEKAALGLEMEYLSVSWDDEYGVDLTTSTVGGLGTVTYNPSFFSFVPVDLFGFVGLGIYNISAESYYGKNSSSSMGFKLGMEASKRLNETILLKGRATYRGLEDKVSETAINFSGFEINSGLEFKF